jgi:DNA-binding response OmpR family regulator
MKKKILVIDDDPKIVLALQIRLKSADYEVLTAADGVKGLLMALELKPDLVIADIMMPLGGGFSMAYRLREKAPEVPLIFITASKQQALRKMADNLGAAGFLEKPFEKDELLVTVAKALRAMLVSSVASPIIGWPDTSKLRAPASASATPATNAQIRPSNATKRPGGITGKNKILIVEDDRNISLGVGLRLWMDGQSVLYAYDALSALNMAVENQPDVVVLDIGLPGGSGLMVAERIQNLVPKFTPIIFITASKQPELRRQAMALGAAGFLEKPFEDGELMAAIQNALKPLMTDH